MKNCIVHQSQLYIHVVELSVPLCFIFFSLFLMRSRELFYEYIYKKEILVCNRAIDILATLELNLGE